ncbi:MAG: anti-sigma factor family protein [Gemmatimonadota bacterium]
MSSHLTPDALNGYVDGLLAPEAARRVEAHLAECRSCRLEAEATRSLLSDLADLPKSLVPERNLRPGIRARIRAGSGAEERASSREKEIERRDSGGVAPSPGRVLWSLRYPLAAAAVLLVLVSSLLTTAVVGKKATSSGGPTAEAGSSTSPADGGGQGALRAAYREVEEEYTAAIQALEASLAERRAQLTPATVRLVEENLRIIDRAISEARVALEADPESPVLRGIVEAAYVRKVDLLLQAARTRRQG